MNDQTFNTVPQSLITFKTDASVNYNPTFDGTYIVDVEYRWSESWYPTPIVVNLSFTVTIVDPCATELTTPTAFPDNVITFGDPDSTLDFSVAISDPMFDFCAYTLTVSSQQTGTMNTASLM